MISNGVVTIPRSEHTISRSLLSPNAVRVLYRLHDHGFISYLVGGCVRDLLLGREPKDFDIVTNATPGQIKRLFRNCRLIGRRFRLAHLHFQDEIIEVATFRSLATGEEPDEEAPHEHAIEAEGHRSPRHLKSEEGMILRDNVFGTPGEDANRRDFTINALFYNIADFSIIDHLGGMYDLRNGIIRIIGDPKQRYVEDPVRMIRAIRFAALLGFTVESETWDTLLEMHGLITKASPARLYEEVLKLLLCGEGSKVWQMLRRAGLAGALFPHFDLWLESEHGGFPRTGPAKSLEWIDNLIQQGQSVSPPLLFVLLFHDYVEEKAERYRNEGLPHQQSLDAAIAELLGELAPTVLIPNRIGIAMRSILSMQRRLQKIPGKQPELFTTRPSFSDALRFLEYREMEHGGNSRLHIWWRTLAEKAPENPPTPAPIEEDGVKKRRRRRRRRRSSAKTHE